MPKPIHTGVSFLFGILLYVWLSLLNLVSTGPILTIHSKPGIVEKGLNSTNPEFNKKKDFSKQIIATSGPPTINKPIASIIVPFKPKLILHVGPMKTGTTSIQLNLLSNSQKIGRHLTTFDNYQILGNPNYRDLGALTQTCLAKHSTHTDLRADGNGADYKCEKNKVWRKIQNIYGGAYDKAMERYYSINNGTIENNATTTDEDFITTINSCESFSTIPRSDFTLELLKDLYEKWDVHIIMFYRPVVDWLRSMYAQHRKHQQLKRYEYIQDYQEVDKNEDTIVQYWNKQKQSLLQVDTFNTYQFYDTLLENLGLSTSSSFGDGKPRIQVLHVYSKLGPEKEMLWNLPHTNHTRQYLENQETNKGFRFKKRNEAMLDSSIDLIITEAWRQNLISIKRREAVVHLDASMKRANITVRDLPQACVSDQDREDLWKRHLESHSKFIKSALDGQEVASLRREFDENKNKLCCVNATAALRVESLRRLLDEDCAFHSQFLVDSKMEPTAQEDLKWTKMNCTV